MDTEKLLKFKNDFNTLMDKCINIVKLEEMDDDDICYIVDKTMSYFYELTTNITSTSDNENDLLISDNSDDMCDELCNQVYDKIYNKMNDEVYKENNSIISSNQRNSTLVEHENKIIKQLINLNYHLDYGKNDMDRINTTVVEDTNMTNVTTNMPTNMITVDHIANNMRTTLKIFCPEQEIEIINEKSLVD